MRPGVGRSEPTAGHVRGGIDQADGQGDPGSADLLAGTAHVPDPPLAFIETHLQP